MKKMHVAAILLFIAMLAIWEWVVHKLAISPLLLPAPSLILSTLLENLASGYFTPHIAQTLVEVLLGLLLGGGIGLAIGIAMGEYAFIRGLFMPYIIVSQAVPKLALAPLFILWLGFGMTPKVVIVALICFFPLLESTVTALQTVDHRQLELFRALRASRIQTLLRLKIPAGLPGILAGFRIATILAIVGAVVGEFIGGSKGLGVVIIASQSMMNTPLMFADLVLLTLLGLLLYGAATLLERMLVTK